MRNNDIYQDFSALDAPEHLTNALRHFFNDRRHTYKFGIAKRHYDDLQHKGGYAEARQRVSLKSSWVLTWLPTKQ